MTEETKPLTSSHEAANYTDAEKGEEGHHRSTFLTRLEEARKESSGPCHFLQQFLLILLDTVGFLIFVGVLLAIPIAMILVGALNLNDCPTDSLIPLWLLISGAILGVQQVVYILKTSFGMACFKERDPHVNKLYGVFNVVVLLAFIGWFIAGNVFVFSAFKPNTTDPSSPDYCESGVYYFSFVLIIIVYAWLLLTMCCSGCIASMGIKKIAHHASQQATGGHGEPEPKK